jgi:hypothetical protein
MNITVVGLATAGMLLSATAALTVDQGALPSKAGSRLRLASLVVGPLPRRRQLPAYYRAPRPVRIRRRVIAARKWGVIHHVRATLRIRRTEQRQSIDTTARPLRVISGHFSFQSRCLLCANSGHPDLPVPSCIANRPDRCELPAKWGTGRRDRSIMLVRRSRIARDWRLNSAKPRLDRGPLNGQFGRSADGPPRPHPKSHRVGI